MFSLYLVEFITLFRAITIFYRTNNIMQNIPHIQSECEIVMALNNVKLDKKIVPKISKT